MNQYTHLSFNKLVNKMNELSEKIDSLDERHKCPFYYKTYEMREQQWKIRQTLVAEFNPMFREHKRRTD